MNPNKNIFSTLLAISSVPLSLPCGIIALIPRSAALVLLDQPFLHYKGAASEKALGAGVKDFKIFTLNTCCMPGGLPYIYGGVSPASQRIDAIAKKIIEEDPDVICLEELHDEQAAHQLIEKLKDNYAHFYFNIGPKLIGQNSGLFVASKFATEAPQFTSFTDSVGAHHFVNKGFFDFSIKSQSARLAHVVNTHLQPSKLDQTPTDKEKAVRDAQLLQIVKKTDQVFQSKHIPSLLTGDLNLVATSEEYKSSALSKNFVDLSIRVDNTWIDPQSQTQMKLDYIAVTKLSRNTILRLDTKCIPFFSTSHPELSLSDHHGLIAEIRKI